MSPPPSARQAGTSRESSPIARLDQRVPVGGYATADAMLEAFLAWVGESGVTLYPHQEEAVLEVFSGNHVILDAPTGSGKSLVATALHFKTLASGPTAEGTGRRAWYTAPIKALVSEKFFELCRTFGAENVGMMTGDASVNRNAPIICCTAEILANLALNAAVEGPGATGSRQSDWPASVVMDEFHYYADRDRGMAWQIPLLTLPNTTFLLMSATLGDTTRIHEDLEQRTQRKVAAVRGVHRPVPLEFSYSMRPFTEALSLLVREGKAPVYVVHFTQNDATEQAQALMSTDWCSKEEKKAIAAMLHGFRFASPFGPTLRRYVAHGIGLHHAGLLPRYRLLVERLAQAGLLKIICGTDTLGVGINVTIRTVLYTQLCKFDGEKTGILKVREFKQIAGRAGRAGYDSVGYVVAQAPAHIIENAMTDIRVTDPKKRRKIVKAQPPTKGYKHWDESTFRQLVERPPEPLESTFAVNHGQLLSLMQSADAQSGDATAGYLALQRLILQSHASPAEKAALTTQAASLLANLREARVVGGSGDGSTAGGELKLELDPTLQHDFSLHHSLSLFLLDALATVDQNHPEGPTAAALEIVTWVEAILENPRHILLKQQDRARFTVLQALKAAGVPYEERIVALEDITWPKPGAEAIYAFFNAYKLTHPWLTGEAIRPKSIVREMAELYTSFADYVKELSLQRSEGVLLRYLSEAYKALLQNVPAESRSDALLDILAYLRAMLATVDASLVTEWETLLAGGDAPRVDVAIKPDISADPRAFLARVRAELHHFVKALSRREWEDAALAIRRTGDDDRWSPAEIEQTLAPFLETNGDVRFDAGARAANLTTVRKTGPHQWAVRQVLPAPPKAPSEADAFEDRVLARDQALHGGVDEEAWAIEGVVDLREDTNPEGPIVRITGIA